MSSIDKFRALQLARSRAASKKKGDAETGGTASASLSSVRGEGTGGSSHLEVASAHKISKRANEEGSEDKAKKKAKMVEVPSEEGVEGLFEGKKDEIPEEILRTRGIPTEIGGFVSLGSGLAPQGLTPSAARAVGYSLTQFQAGRGWLGSPSKGVAPLEALNIFTLSPDKELMATEVDEKLIEATREALGQVKQVAFISAFYSLIRFVMVIFVVIFQLGTRVMRLVERTKWNIRQAKIDRLECDKERTEKGKALKGLAEIKKKVERLQEELRKGKEALRQRDRDLSKTKEDIEVEQGITESMRLEMDRVKDLVAVRDEELKKKTEEIERVTKALETVAKEAVITYQDCVDKYKKSQDFKDEVVAAAGSFHAEGFQDCLNFVGAGNVVNFELHSVERFQEAFLGEPPANP